MSIPFNNKSSKTIRIVLIAVLTAAFFFFVPIPLRAGNPCAENPCAVNPCGGTATTTDDTTISTTTDEPIWGSIPGVNTGLTSPEEPGTTTEEPGIYIDTETSFSTGDDGKDWTDVIRDMTTRERKPTTNGGGTTTATDDDDDDGDDPRDAGGEVYGEEIDPPEPRYGILLVRGDDSWVPEHINQTTVIAKIYEPRSATSKAWVPSSSLARQIKVFFVERSNEKGSSLNKDLRNDPQDSPDLFLLETPEIACKDDPTGRRHFGSCQTHSELNEHTFHVRSEDWGSFSIMDASCDGCVPLVGVPATAAWGSKFPLAVEEADREKYLPRVPRDNNDNQISDGYEPDQMDDKRPEDDDDDKPDGDGTDGDGYSAYEEYRGFNVINHPDGPHVRTDWKVKNLFVENPSGLDGIKDFVGASEIEVYEMQADQHKDRVVNFNYGHGHVVDQHGVIVKPGVTTKSSGGKARGGPGMPKDVYLIEIYLANHKSAASIKGTVVHELGHAVNVWHHGKGKKFTEMWYPPGTWRDLSPFHNTYNRPVICGKRLPANIKFVEKHSQSSGKEDCYMRYRHRRRAVKQEDGTIDCMGRPPARAIFCESPRGAAFNAGNRTSGDAARGDCKSQFHVNDG